MGSVSSSPVDGPAVECSSSEGSAPEVAASPVPLDPPRTRYITVPSARVIASPRQGGDTHLIYVSLTEVSASARSRRPGLSSAALVTLGRAVFATFLSHSL